MVSEESLRYGTRRTKINENLPHDPTSVPERFTEFGRAEHGSMMQSVNTSK